METKTFHLDVYEDGTVSLWDTELQAKLAGAEKGRCYVSLVLTQWQIDRLKQAMEVAQGKRKEVSI